MEKSFVPMNPIPTQIVNNMSFGACAPVIKTAPMVSTVPVYKTTPVVAPRPIVGTTLSALHPVAAHSKHDLCGKNKRIKRRRRRAFANDDPRRNYVDSIFGAINSGDGVLSTLERIAHPEVVMTCRFLGDPSTITTGKLYREVKGRDQIAKFVDCMLMASPDAVMKLHEKKMRLRQNNSSYIVAKYTLEGYKFCNLLTTNDKHVTKKVQMPTPKIVSPSNLSSGSRSFTTSSQDGSESNVIPTLFNTISGSSSNSLGDESEEEDDEDQWSDNFFDEIASQFSNNSLPLDYSAVSSATNIQPSDEHFNNASSQLYQRSESLLQASQFLNRNCFISGYDQKISIASATSEFGLSQSLSIPVLVSTIGTMALHINPNRQVYKIDFLWTYNQNSKQRAVVADEIRMIHN